MKNCLFDGTCYNAKMMPTVDTVSMSQGFAEGGQTLVIKGTSLDGDVTVTVDGVPCAVQSVGRREVTCVTGKKDLSIVTATPTSYAGQQGLTRYRFSGNRKSTWRDMVDGTYM